ncbi:MAG: DoxX family protein [Gammaproteobacteria bacterium]
MNRIAADDNTTRLFIPALGPIYDRLSAWTGLSLRIVTGGIMIPHGYEHFFGRQTLPEWFTGIEPQAAPHFGAGLDPFTGFLASQGYEPAYFWAVMITLVQFLGGILLMIGLLTRLTAAAFTIFLFVSIFQVAAEFGYWGNAGGLEFPLLWCIASFIFVVRGGGRLSVDHVIGKEL